jgi:hypothetical protein
MTTTTPFVTENWDVTVWVKVQDPEELYEAAAGHPDCCDAAELKDVDGNVDIGACLRMLIDPGSLPGCKVVDSGAEWVPPLDGE